VRRVLHAGCGGAKLPPWSILAGEEVRLDIDARHKPHVVASITDLGEIGTFDAVFCCHTLEHLHPADGKRALGEFLRVLNPGGLAVVMVPNLDGIKPTRDVVYQSPSGPITGWDMYYGWSVCTEHNPYMRHQNGFVPDTLRKALDDAGFFMSRVVADDDFNLIGIAAKGDQ
jgi:SAM-dependent methyltransferase